MRNIQSQEVILQDFFNNQGQIHNDAAPEIWISPVPNITIDTLQKTETSWRLQEDDKYSEYPMPDLEFPVNSLPTPNASPLGSSQILSSPTSFLSVPSNMYSSATSNRQRSPSIGSNFSFNSEITAENISGGNQPQRITSMSSPSNTGGISPDFSSVTPTFEENFDMYPQHINHQIDSYNSHPGASLGMNDNSSFAQFDGFYNPGNINLSHNKSDLTENYNLTNLGNCYISAKGASEKHIIASSLIGLGNPHSLKTAVLEGKFWKTLKLNGNTVYQCPFNDCLKTFTRPYNLKSHYRAHTGERPFVCQKRGCDSSFSRKHDLKRHLKLHSDEKEFKCKACRKSFSRKDALGRHLRPSDKGEKESICALRLQLMERDGALERLKCERQQILEGTAFT